MDAAYAVSLCIIISPDPPECWFSLLCWPCRNVLGMLPCSREVGWVLWQHLVWVTHPCAETANMGWPGRAFFCADSWAVSLWRLIHSWEFLVVWALEVFQNRYFTVDEKGHFLWNCLSSVCANVEAYYILLLKCSKNSDFIYSLNCCPLKPLWSRLNSNGDGWKGWFAERASGIVEGIRSLQYIKNNQV